MCPGPLGLTRLTDIHRVLCRLPGSVPVNAGAAAHGDIRSTANTTRALLP
jgi:hypothetical protein